MTIYMCRGSRTKWFEEIRHIFEVTVLIYSNVRCSDSWSPT